MYLKNLHTLFSLFLIKKLVLLENDKIPSNDESWNYSGLLSYLASLLPPLRLDL